MAERTSGEDGPGENQEPDNAGEEPAQASSSWERPGARPGNTPARQPLTEYKKWYNRNRPGKKERQEGAKARGIPPPPGVLKGHDTKGKDSKGKEKGKDKGKQYKGVPGKGKGQPGKVGGRTPPPPPPRKRPAAALVQPGDSQNPADEQEYGRSSGKGQDAVGAESSFYRAPQGWGSGQEARPRKRSGSSPSRSSW